MKRIILSILFLALSVGQHFTLDIDQTGESTLFIFTDTIVDLEIGDEIGLFDPNGIIDSQGNTGELLVGASIWTEEQLEIVAIGAADLSDFGGPVLPGYTAGNTMSLKIWDISESIEFPASYTTSFGSGSFNGLFSTINEVSFINCEGGDCGCTDVSACNYDPSAIGDDGSCEYLDVCGECGGDGINEAIGECGCDGEIFDCNSDCFHPDDDEFAVEDNCGICDNQSWNDCVEDCAGVWGGTAVIDDCGICGGENAAQDCAGECFGNAELDCASFCNGDSYEDNCDNCDNDPTNDCVQDCNGIWGGDAEEDCSGECGGLAVIDDCGICDGNNAAQDCTGVCFGDTEEDCLGVCEGSAVVDDCGVCDGNNADQDCAGECFGDAELDECGICNGPGGNTECWDGVIVCDINDCTDAPVYTDVDYESEIQPIFNANCTYYCHSNGGSYQGSLDLTSYDNLMSGNSDHGPVVIPEDSENSILIQKLSNNPPFGDQMPAYASPLDPSIIFLIATWIDEGALSSDGGSGGGGGDGGIGGEDDIEGCTDPIAENYNSDANVDDGTCTYAPMGELTFGAIDYTDNTLEINLDCEYDVSSFTFDLTGINITGYFGGTTEVAGFDIIIEDSTVSGNANNDNIPANSGHLLTITYDTFTSDEVCFSNSNITTYIGIEYEAILDDCLLLEENGDILIDISLSAGWNWISVNAIQDNMDINVAFSNLSAQPNDYIKSQTVASTYYDGYGWYPAFNIEVERMYLLNLANAGTMTYEGSPVDPATAPIELASGWNWIGYIPQTPIGVNTALQNVPLIADDYIKSQTIAATYYPGYGFYPSFDMNPTAGYMLKVESSSSFTYPSGEFDE